MAKEARKKPVEELFIDRGEPLPQSYAVNRIVAMVRDPENVFCYWDVETEVRVASRPLLLRVYCVTENRSWDMEPGPGTDNWYFRVTPNRTYRFELFEKRPDGLRPLATSRDATTPVRWAGESGAYPPEEILMAEQYPIARRGGKRPPRRAVPVERPAGIAPHTPSPAPVPIPPPMEKTFGAFYTRGGK